MKALCRAVVVGCAAAFLLAGAARAETVDVALVLAADVSRSIDDEEFALQRDGYAAALTDPRVLQAIQSGVNGAVAICYVEWASPDQQEVVVDWTIVRDGEGAAAAADKLRTAPRSFLGRTAIGAAIEFALGKLAASGVTATRRVIDVSGDGTNNAGTPVTAARDRAVAAGVTVNGLAIINEHANYGYVAHTQPPGGLPAYYRANVIGGPGAFLLTVESFDSFGEAVRDKIVSEISGVPPDAAFAGDLRSR